MSPPPTPDSSHPRPTFTQPRSSFPHLRPPFLHPRSSFPHSRSSFAYSRSLAGRRMSVRSLGPRVVWGRAPGGSTGSSAGARWGMRSRSAPVPARALGRLLAVGVALAALGGCVQAAPAPAAKRAVPGLGDVTSFSYVLQRYAGGRLDEVARGPQQLAIVDLSRDGTHSGFFTRDEITRVRATGKLVLAYFEIGSIEEFRTDFRKVDRDLLLHKWPDWPDEYFARYWEERWWEQVVRPRVDRALDTGFDGVYLDTPLAYEEIDLKAVPGETRDTLGRKMADLVIRISRHAKERRPGFAIVPQNSPELRHFSGYADAIDGVGMEELFFRATDVPCAEGWCRENLADALALKALGKAVLATDYAVTPANVAAACARYREHAVAGNVTVVDLDRVSPPCQPK